MKIAAKQLVSFIFEWVGSRKSLDSEIFQKYFRNLIQKFFRKFSEKNQNLDL